MQRIVKIGDMGVDRDGQPKEISLTTTEEGKIGVLRFGPDRYFDFERQDYTLAQGTL